MIHDEIRELLTRSLGKGSAKQEDIIILSVTTVPDGVVVVWRRWINDNYHEHRMSFVTKDLHVKTDMLAQVGR